MSRSTPGGTWILGACLVAALAIAGCSTGADDHELAADDPVEADRSEPDDDGAPAPTTTSIPPGGRQPDGDDPLRVLFTGDSIGAEVAAPAMAALGGGGSVVNYFVANPSIPRDPARKALWEARLAESDPEVVVVLVGVWERMGFGRDQQQGQTVGEYRREVIDPFVDLVTSQGAELVWVSSPLVEDLTASSQIAFLDEAFRGLGESDDRVEYIDAAGLVAGPDGEFIDVVAAADGSVERVRRLDGTHLCPGGAVRMATPLIESVAQRWNLPVDADWPAGTWRAAVPFEDAPTECPAVR